MNKSTPDIPEILVERLKLWADRLIRLSIETKTYLLKLADMGVVARSCTVPAWAT